MTQNTSVLFHRKLIIALAAKHRLPAVYASRFLVTDGGLLSYGPNLLDNYRRAAGYVDRILKGEKPADSSVDARRRIVRAVKRPRCRLSEAADVCASYHS